MITKDEMKAAMLQLSMLKFFPQGEAQKAIAMFLAALCGRGDRLIWLVGQIVNHVGEWPGPAEVRGLFCSRFRPADGIEADCTLPGFSPEDGERISAARDPKPLVAGDAKKLIAGLQSQPTLDEQIAEQREIARRFSKSPATVRGCLERIAELEAKREVTELPAEDMERAGRPATQEGLF